MIFRVSQTDADEPTIAAMEMTGTRGSFLGIPISMTIEEAEAAKESLSTAIHKARALRDWRKA